MASSALPRSVQTQQWFRKRGLTLLLGGTPLAKGTSERAAPVLVGWFLLVMLIAVPAGTSLTWWHALLLGIGVVIVAWVASNLLRRRPAFAPVAKIGWLESLVFVLAPSVVIALNISNEDLGEFGETEIADFVRTTIALMIGLVQFVALLVILALEKLGVVTLASWLTRTLVAALAGTSSALSTSLPVSLGVVFFFLLNPGVWGTLGRLTPAPYFSVIFLLLALAAAFLGSQRNLRLDALTGFPTEADYRAALADTPLADAADVDVPAKTPLGPLQRFYVRQVAVLSQLVVGAVIALAVFVLFLLIGYLAVDGPTVEAFTRKPPQVLFSFQGAYHEYILSWAHLRVAGFLATFAAFNYSLASATDGRLRHDTLETASDTIRQACAMRIALLAMEQGDPFLAEVPLAPETPAPTDDLDVPDHLGQVAPARRLAPPDAPVAADGSLPTDASPAPDADAGAGDAGGATDS